MKSIPSENKNDNDSSTLKGNVRSFSVIHVVTLLHDSGKSGRFVVECRVQEKIVQKTLFFDKGEIVFAASNVVEDRLGECLLRLGRISKQQFDQASKLLVENPGSKLGKILVEHQFITPGQLWTGVKNQVEHIFLSVLQIKEGQFSFIEGKIHPPAVVRLPQSVRDLILQGAQHIDELKIFAEKIINRESTFEKVLPGPKTFKAGPLEKELLGLIDGEKKVRDILLLSSTSAFVTFNVLSKLMLAKVIQLKKAKPLVTAASTDLPVAPTDQPPEPMVKTPAVVASAAPEPLASPEKEPENLFGLFHKNNQAYVEIQQCLAQKGVDLTKDLQEYFSDTASPFHRWFQGQKWLPQGGFDPGQFFAQAGGQTDTFSLSVLSQALEDLLFFLLFKAQSLLAKSESEVLMQKIEEIQRDE